MGMLKLWAEQFIRDEDYLHIGHWSAPPEWRGRKNRHRDPSALHLASDTGSTTALCNSVASLRTGGTKWRSRRLCSFHPFRTRVIRCCCCSGRNVNFFVVAIDSRPSDTLVWCISMPHELCCLRIACGRVLRWVGGLCICTQEWVTWR